MIELDFLSIRKLMHHGIDWIFDLNSDINIDIYNSSLGSGISEDICVKLSVKSLYEQGVNEYQLNLNDFFPDEDFCLYARIPFQRVILINFEIDPNLQISCTCLWIASYMRILSNFCSELTEYQLFTITDKNVRAIYSTLILNASAIRDYCFINFAI